MECKYCGAELADWGNCCPVCGKNNNAEEEKVEQESWETAEVQEDQTAVAKPNQTKRRIAMIGCVAALALLAVVLVWGIQGGWDLGSLFNWGKSEGSTTAPGAGIGATISGESYMGTDADAIKEVYTVVATMGDMELTNAQLQFYYWSEVYDFLNTYYYYLSYIGFDYTKPLANQVCYFDETVSWETYFLECALEVWQSKVAFAKEAEADGFAMPEDLRAELDGMKDSLQKTADENGYESLDAMVQESYGSNVTYADYEAYMEVYYLAYAYYESLYNTIDPSLEELDAYYTANQEALEAEGIVKDDSYTVDVRHILMLIDNFVTDEETTEEKDEYGYTQSQWDACRAAAQEIYDLYLAGELTEERFGELANEHSDDNNGNVTNGGLYTYVAEGDMVEDFNGWCFDEERQTGDTDIVWSKYGYHIMYFVGSEAAWINETRQAYIYEQSNQIVAGILEQYTIDIDYDKIILTEVTL